MKIKPIRRAVGIFLLLVFVEMLMRVAYPGSAVVEVGHVRLQADTQVPVWITNEPTPLVPEFSYSLNELGFRSAPQPSGAMLPVYIVGNEFAFCPLLEDSLAWPNILQRRLNMSFTNVWVVNACIPGHNTTQDRVLVGEYLSAMPPGIMLLAPGLEELEPTLLTPEQQPHVAPTRGSFERLLRYSRLFALIADKLAGTKNGVHIDYPAYNQALENQASETKWAGQLEKQTAFRGRVEALLRTTVTAGHQPVLVTQPLQAAYDSERWQAMEAYNETLRNTALDLNLRLIDLGRLLPKEDRYWLDARNLSPDGAEKVADRLHGPLRGWLKAGK